MRNISISQRVRLGFHHKLLVWWHGRNTGPKVGAEAPPLGTLNPTIAQIQHDCDRRMHKLAQIWSSEEFTIGAAMFKGLRLSQRLAETSMELDGAVAELETLGGDLQKQQERFRRNHDGDLPGRASIFEDLKRWGLMVILGLSEMPLMSAALDRLAIPDWEQLVATIGASTLTISLAGLIGRWFAKRGKTIGQAAFGWLLVAILVIILGTTALLRSQATKERESRPAIPEVFFHSNQRGHRNV
jgi:hypothetical protein